MGYAAKKVPDLFRDQVMPKLEDRGSDEAAKMGKQAVDKMKDQSGIAGKVAGSVAGKVGGGNGDGGGKKTRRLPIQRYTDVAVPVEVAYKAWTEFDKFPNFMHRVRSVEKTGNDEVQWEEKIWFSKRQWKGKITERRKNDRIAWKTTSGTQHSGIVSFHKIGDNLTRVMVTVDFHPTGMIEKMGSGPSLREARGRGRPRPLQDVRRDEGREGAPVRKRQGRRRRLERRQGLERTSRTAHARRARPTSEQERKQRAERRKQRQA